MENKFKPRAEKEKTNGATASAVPIAPGPSIFSGIERKLRLESYFEEGFPIEYLPKILFVVFLSLLYIGNTHHADTTTRQIDKMRSEVEDLRADYTTLKADVMFATKQSEVARRVKAMGLNESLRPPFKIVVEDGEY
jgi:hypothetical protein